MRQHRRGRRLTGAAIAAFALAIAPATLVGADRQTQDHPRAPSRIGGASYYAPYFAGRTMADGTPMRPDSDNAASRTLPLGTVALVTNLHNGRVARVTIRDRGPYVRGRIIDVSPRTADLLGMRRAGVVQVHVQPVYVPPADDETPTVVAALETGRR